MNDVFMTTPTLFVLAALGFGSLSMLGWLAAAVLPWLIHRWHRRRHRTTEWAAVDLLLAAVRQNKRKVSLQQWLLIAMRTAILVLVALAAADPILRDWALGAGAGGRTHLILVIDQSYSMSVGQGDSSSLERAKVQARQLIESRTSGDVFSVIGWTVPVDNVMGRPVADVSLALSAIDSLVQSETTAVMSDALQAALAAISRAESEVLQLSRHEIVFLSDFTRNTWKATSAEQSRIEQLAGRANLTIIDVSEGPIDNVTIVDLAVEPKIVLRQQEVTFPVRLRSFGKQTWDEITIELSIDGRQVESQQVALPDGGETLVSFTQQFEEAGVYHIQVALSEDLDQLPIDNRRSLVVEVRPQMRVACIAGVPGAADDIARAFSPGKPSAQDKNAVRSEIHELNQLSQLDSSSFDAVFLCDVPYLNPGESAQLARYVQAGGSLAILLGEQSAAARLNHAETEGGLGDLLPVVLHQAMPVGEYSFDALGYQHSVLEPFRAAGSSGLGNVAVMSYWRCENKPDHQSAATVMAFDTGDPAVVVDQFGLGRLAVVAIPCSLKSRTSEGSPWSSFAVSPSFLPVMRELATYLVGDSRLQQRNILVGQTAICHWSAVTPEREIEVRRPDGTTRTLMLPGAEDLGQTVLADTAMSGVYQLTVADESIASFAVNLDTQESDLTTIGPEDLSSEFTIGPASPMSEGQIRAAGYSFAPGLLVGALILLLSELALACWLGRGWQ